MLVAWLASLRCRRYSHSPRLRVGLVKQRLRWNHPIEKKFYGAWSQETRKLLADGEALAAYKRRAFDLYRQRFAPEALLRRVDAWNERGAPDGWQDPMT